MLKFLEILSILPICVLETFFSLNIGCFPRFSGGLACMTVILSVHGTILNKILSGSSSSLLSFEYTLELFFSPSKTVIGDAIYLADIASSVTMHYCLIWPVTKLAYWANSALQFLFYCNSRAFGVRHTLSP